MERFSPPLILLLSVLLFLCASSPGDVRADEPPSALSSSLAGQLPQPFESDDKDLRIADTYFAMDVASSATIAGFGIGAVAAGVESFILAASTGGQTSSQHLFGGLTLVSLGSASLVSGISGIESSHRGWKVRRRALWRGGPGERRVLRAREVIRLRRRARSHAMGVAADGTFLGLGIAMSLLGPPQQAIPLVVNGAFVLGLDIFQLILDDQTARAWERRSEEVSGGFFGRASHRRSPRILAVGLSALPPREVSGVKEEGFSFSMTGVF
jgi:hypothetical protein